MSNSTLQQWSDIILNRPMDNLYYVLWETNKVGIGKSWIDACLNADQASFHNYQSRLKEHEAFEWSKYIQRQARPLQGARIVGRGTAAPVFAASNAYEVCSVSFKGQQICQVFRSPSKQAIAYLINKYGTPKHLSPEFATIAKPKRIQPKNKSLP